MLRLAARVALCVAVLGLALPGPSAAQLTSLGAVPTMPATDLNAIAFDEVNNVYLHVGSRGVLTGRFVNSAGVTVGGQFSVSAGLPGSTYASWMGAAYSSGSSAGVFLVAYASEINGNQCKNVFGQLVRFNGAGGELVGGAFPLSSVPILGSCRSGGVAQEVSGITFNPITNQFLVVWSDQRGGWDVYGRLVNVDGSMPGGEINLTFDPAYQGQPTVAHDWRTNTFLVAYIADVTSVTTGTFAKVLNSAAQPITGPLTLDAGGYQDLPSAMYLPEPGRFLVVWRATPSGTVTDVMGRQVQPDGAISGTVYPVIATSVFDGVPDGRYNWISRNVLVTAQHDSGYAVGALLDANGTPQFRWTPLSTVPPAARGGTFRPHVATGAGGQYGVSYVMDQALGYVERFAAIPASVPGPSYGGGQPPPAPPPPVTIDLSPGAAPNGSWFLAEGVASDAVGGFDTYYLLSNIDPTTPVNVTMYFSKDDGTTVKKERTVAPNTRETIRLRDAVGLGSYGAVFQSTTPGKQIYVERSVYFGTDWEGSTSEVATGTAHTTWHFAEGSRRGEVFANFFLLFNPQQVAANVQATFVTERGTTVARAFSIGPQKRYTLSANEIPELAGLDFSTTFLADQPLVAERAMYFATVRGGPWTGGMAAIGTNAPASRWLFAEGAAATDFHTFYTILNPNGNAVTLTVNYLRENLGLRTITYTVKANTRDTLHLGQQIGNALGVSAEFLSSGGPIVVERSTYWGANGWIEGTTVMGATAPACEWILPEGSLKGSFDDFLLIGNPTNAWAKLNVSVYLENGERYTIPVEVEPFGRKTIDMDHFFEASSGAIDTTAQPLLSRSSFATRVACQPNSAPVLVEHALYINSWRGGAAAFGIAR